MAVYAIGDVQGCYDELQSLLELIRFDPAHDRLWFAGDLVNRGPKSLETLRFVRGLGSIASCVLGNHDLHLIAVAHDQPLDRDDHTLDAILRAPDRDELIDWLRCQPLMHHDASLGFTMIHAGLPPQWDLQLALRCAHEVEAILCSDQLQEFLAHHAAHRLGDHQTDDEYHERISSNAAKRFREVVDFDHEAEVICDLLEGVV